MTWSKRLFDLVIAISLTIILAPFIAIIAILILLKDGRPIFYISERMKTPIEGFSLYKFRTMKTVKIDSGVSGGDKAFRITTTGRFLRDKRVDEFPQLLNVIKGDISFVGPRPPLRQYVENHPEIYSKVLVSRPGITGLASIVFHAHEERLLARCKSTDETNEIYSRICIPRKAHLDLIYQHHSSLCYDAILMFKTALRRS